MLDDWTDIGGAATVPARAMPSDSKQGEAALPEGPDYTSYLHGILAPHRLDDLFPYTPEYRDCPWTWTPHETTRRYLRALTAAHGPHEMRARLVAARHRLVPERRRCPDVESMDGYVDALRVIDGQPWQPWRDYLEGAARFYAEDYDSALEPLLRASLAGGDYRAFVDLAPLARRVQRDLKAHSDRWWQGPQALRDTPHWW